MNEDYPRTDKCPECGESPCECDKEQSDEEISGKPIEEVKAKLKKMKGVKVEEF